MLLDLAWGGLAPNPLLILLLALALDAVLGEWGPLFRVLPHPIVIIGNTIGFLERKLNRPHRSDTVRYVRGFTVLLLMLILSIGLGLAAHIGLRSLPWGWLGELLLVSLLVAQKSLHDHVALVARGLDGGGLKGGRLAVSMIVGRDPESLDEHGVARAAIESCAENFSDGIVAPVFWYLVAGLPGILAYKTINTLDSMIGHRSARYLEFGYASAKLDDFVNLIPARFSALLIVIAAAVQRGASAGRAFATALRDARHHRSPNAGWPEAAMAGALGLALAGPRRYGEITVNDRWIGEGRARATAQDIRRALSVYRLACLALAGLVAAAYWLLVNRPWTL